MTDLAPLTRAEAIAKRPRMSDPLTAEEQALLERCERVLITRYGEPGTQQPRHAGVTKSDQRPHDVYVHLDAANTVLYVGISLTLAERTSYHRANSGWWQQVATIRIEHLSSRAAALAREAELIIELKPLHNRAGVA
jgi:hypothetical protein